MPRVLFSALLGMLLAVSLALKVSASNAVVASDDPGEEDIQTALTRQGFEIELPAPNTDPRWIAGARDGCEIRIGNVSPQGWHRRVVEWQASGQRLVYSFAGELSDRQSTTRTLIAHYTRKLLKSFGIDGAPVKVRAVILGPGCTEAMIPEQLLRGLS